MYERRNVLSVYSSYVCIRTRWKKCGLLLGGKKNGRIECIQMLDVNIYYKRMNVKNPSRAGGIFMTALCAEGDCASCGMRFCVRFD